MMNNSKESNSKRAALLADRILQGANMLLDFSKELSDKEWELPVTGDAGFFHLFLE